MRRVRELPRRTLVPVGLALLVAGSALAFGFAHRAAAATRPATAGIVVVNTNLGYAGGRAAGTGMVLTSSGEVLTNNHVIEGATKITVRVPGTSRRYAATVLGYDVGADTALLQLRRAHGLATVSLGTSALKRGQVVRAVGNAGGTGRLSLVRGTVTGLGRTITAQDDSGRPEQLKGLIQTDAAIQPGDSGGPLLDASGRVAGMDTAASVGGSSFYWQASSSQSFAIPISKAIAVAHRIEKGDETAAVHIGSTAFLGVLVSTGGGYGYGYGSQSSAGTVVAGVVSGSPAARAGLAYGDQIVGIAGRTVTSPTSLVNRLLRRHPGDAVALTWLDAFGNRQTATVTLALGPPQ